MTSKVYLFTGVETFNWKLPDFADAITFCKLHNIDGLMVKIYESTTGEWYKSIGISLIQQAIEGSGLDFIPYGFYYVDDTPQQLLTIVQYLNSYKTYVIDLETSFDGAGKVQPVVNALTKWSHNSRLWVCTWANPLDHIWTQNINMLDQYVDTWMPMEYSDALIQDRLKQFPKVRGNVSPVYLANGITINNVAITPTPSLWEYQVAVANPSWVDSFVKHIKGDTPVTPQPLTQPKKWFEFPVGVPFGNPNFDVGLNGSHDMTFLAPANYPVTSIVPGVISDISSPSWGQQVGVLMDSPHAGHKWFHYLHLSAVNPSLKVGQRINYDDLIGWVGGGVKDSDYNGTTNPTGKNFLNTAFNSSQIQVGIALMDGPAYGGPGWKNFPPIDHTLDPLPIVEEYKLWVSTHVNMLTMFTYVWLSAFGGVDNGKQWQPFRSGIYNVVFQAYTKNILGLVRPTSGEIPLPENGPDGKPVLLQLLSNGYYVTWVAGRGYIYNSENVVVFQGNMETI